MADVTGLEAELRANGISVESLDPDGTVEVTYMTAFPGERVEHGEIGRACNALLDAARADEWEPTRVEATVVRSPGDVLGTWHVEGEWFAALLDGEMTETEFSTRVLDTLSESRE